MAAEKEKGKKRLIEDPLEKCTARGSALSLYLYFFFQEQPVCVRLLLE
jgi:hypothetical protein